MNIIWVCALDWIEFIIIMQIIVYALLWILFYSCFRVLASVSVLYF
jgi:hypothetical protein